MHYDITKRKDVVVATNSYQVEGYLDTKVGEKQHKGYDCTLRKEETGWMG